MAFSSSGYEREDYGKGQTLPPRGFPSFTSRDRICCVGYALVLAWSFFLLWTPASSMIYPADDQQIHTLRMFFFVGAALSGILIAPLSKTLLVGKGEVTVCVISLLLMIQGFFVANFHLLPERLLWISWLLNGLGISTFLFLWTKYMTLMQMRKLFFLNALSWGLGALLFLLCFLTPWSCQILTIFPVIATVMLLVVQAKQDLRTELLRARSEGAFTLKGYFKNNQLFSMGYSVGYGFMLSYVTCSHFSPDSTFVIGLVMILTVILYILNMYLRYRNPGLVLYSFIIPLSFIFIAGTVGSTSATWTFVFAGLFFFLFVWSDLQCVTTAVVSARFHKENYAVFFGFTRGLNYIAVLVGWVLAYWASFVARSNLGLFLAASICFALLAFLISGTFFDKDRLTLALSYSIGAADYDKRSKAEPIQRFFDEDDLFELKDDNPAVEVVETTKLEDPLEEAIEVLAMEYHLSPREYEVFVFLAHGRNAEYIANKLVISMATAKSHTYNIYTKLGVHSRQELMDLVESMAPPPPAKF